MRYDIYDINYILDCWFNCYSGTCVAYEGDIPSGYDSLQEWYDTETAAKRLNAWKIVDGQLEYDSAKNDELQNLYEKQDKDNSYVCHKELFEMQEQLEDIQDVNDSQYKKDTASGKIININNVKKVFPKVKLTNIQPYVSNTIKLITTGKNMLPNEATSQTISGIEFTQNTDRSISISGTSTSAIEYNIAGTSTNTSPFLCFKKNLNYYLTTSGLTIKMYSYDGTDRTQVYSGTGGAITFTDSDKSITQIVISIANGTTLDTTCYPQLEYSSSASTYEMYKSRILNIDLSNYIENATIGYVLIESGCITALIDSEITTIGYGNVGLFDGVDIIYAIQDLNIEIDYCIDILNVDNLEFLQGKSTTTNKFKILPDGSIEANNGKFTGGKINLSDNATSSTDTASLMITSNVYSGTYTKHMSNLTQYHAESGTQYYGTNIQPRILDLNSLNTSTNHRTSIYMDVLNGNAPILMLSASTNGDSDGYLMLTDKGICVNDYCVPQQKTLWENEDITSSFAAQSVTLNETISNFDYYEVVWKQRNNSNYCWSTGKIPVGNLALGNVSSGFKDCYRYLTDLSDTSATFGACSKITTYGGSATTTTNDVLIPIQIIGYKCTY